LSTRNPIPDCLAAAAREFFCPDVNQLTRPGDTSVVAEIFFPTNNRSPEGGLMTVDILREEAGLRIDRDLQVVLVMSLLGFMLALALLPLLGADAANVLMLAG
jgi:hypothetical protein